MRRRRCSRELPVLLFLAVLASDPLPAVLALGCASGVIQLQLQRTPHRDQSGCFTSPPTPTSIKALCGTALRVTVRGSTIALRSLSQQSFRLAGPALLGTPFSCKDYNATGALLPGSNSAARITLYDNVGGPASTLTRTAPNRITLSPAPEYGAPAGLQRCQFHYSVVSGCVFGIQAPAVPPACPSGSHIQAAGRTTKFCAPCPAGTTSRGPNAPSCTPCPPGTATAPTLGSPCAPCPPTFYAPKPGARYCQLCPPSDNTYTDGRTCAPCPTGSYPDRAVRGRCVKCAAGRKCCTVGDGPDCPKCKRGTQAAPATSVFALQSAAPAACLAARPALRAPAINITVAADCQIHVSSGGYNAAAAQGQQGACPWSATVPMKGTKPSAMADLADLPGFVVDPSTEDAAVSALRGARAAATAPFLDFTLPASGCTLRYRALTKPVAALLGARPRPAAPGTCPRGHYRDSTSDTKPGPCLPCPPGTEFPQPGVCIPCRPGTFAGGYSTPACTPCPEYQTSEASAASCSPCRADEYPVDATACRACPAGTGSYLTDGGSGSCLGNSGGSICCAAGDCQLQPRCSGARQDPAGAEQKYHAVLRVSAVSSSAAACRNAALLQCLEANDLVALTSVNWRPALTLDVIGKLCPGEALPLSYSGGFASPSRALLSAHSFRLNATDAYELLSDPRAGTVTMYLAARPTAPPAPSHIPSCSATLVLLAGRTFDLAAPPSATCPPAAGFTPTTLAGRTFCPFCAPGTFLAPSTGRCTACPAGTYSAANGATRCAACPAGAYCPAGAAAPTPCPPGTAAARARQSHCTACPPNTRSGRPEGATRCTPCTKGQYAPERSSACSFPFAPTATV